MGEILFITHRIPWPPDRGDKIRSHWILKRLTAIAPVHVATFAEDERDEGFAEEMAAITAGQCVVRRDKPLWRAGVQALSRREPVSLAAFRDRRLQRYVTETLAHRPVDRILVFSGQVAQYVPRRFASRVFVDFCDVDSAKFESYAAEGNPLMRWVNRREGRLLADWEAEMARRAEASLFVSDAEADLFARRSGLSRESVLAMPNGIDHRYFDPYAEFPPADLVAHGVERKERLIVFTGQMDYRPNVAAARDFALNVLPEIRRAAPRACFAIVGRAPSPAVQALGSEPGVIVTGAVDDVRSWLAAADLVVAPLRIARGIQNKVLEAMAMARPVIASAEAAEGIEAADGVHFRIAADPADEARIAAELLAYPERAAAMGRAARTHIVRHYGWSAALRPLERLLEESRAEPVRRYEEEAA